MRKSELFAVICLALALAGCSPQYSAEKAFYRANRYSADIFKDSANIPPYKFEKAAADFQSIIKMYPDTAQAMEAYFIVGNIYILQDRYAEAAGVFKKVQAQYQARPEVASRAMTALADCYEKASDWGQAFKTYREAFEKYPDLPGTLPVPLHILDHYIATKEIDKRDWAQQEAVKDYKKLIARYPDSKLAYAAKNMLAEAYIRGDNWNEMLAVLSDLVKNYPRSPDAPTWLMTMAATYDVKLNDKAKARESYQIIKDKYKQSPWAQEAVKRLQVLKP